MNQCESIVYPPFVICCSAITTLFISHNPRTNTKMSLKTEQSIFGQFCVGPEIMKRQQRWKKKMLFIGHLQPINFCMAILHK